MKLALASKAFARLSMATLGAAWNSWVLEVQRYNEEKKAMTQLLSRILKFKLSLGFNQWVSVVKLSKEAERVAAAKAAATRRVISRLLSSATTKALQQWKVACRFLEMEAETQAEKGRLMNLMSRQALETRTAQAQGQMRRVVKGMMLSKLRSGWRS